MAAAKNASNRPSLSTLSAIATITTEELKHAREDRSCIMAGVVYLEVLSGLGFEGAYPLTVKPQVFNPAYAERQRTRALPSSEEDREEWSAAGCKFVAVGHGEGRPDAWAGHLVAVVPDVDSGKALVVDLTIPQANVPKWGIELRPLAFLARADFLSGAAEFKVPVNGSLAVYMAFPDDRSFERTPVWVKTSKRRTIVRGILKRVDWERLG